MTLQLLSQCLALAARLEDEGQNNNAKLMRAAAEALLTQAAYQQPAPADLAAAFSQTIAALKQADLPASFIAPLERGAAALGGGRLALYHETPDPFICRTCGHTVFEESAAPCPDCGADAATFKRYRAVFWLDAFDPFAALAHLRQTPHKVAALLAGLDEERLGRQPAGHGWSARQAVSHLRDAQGVLQFRLQLMLEQDDPVLESKAVFEWATDEADRPPTSRETPAPGAGTGVFEDYRAARAQTLAVLESIALKDWWRTGRHEEFGHLTLQQQASYFAAHELIHLPQIQALVRA